MRTQALILGIGCGCLVLAATAMVSQQRTARAEAETHAAVEATRAQRVILAAPGAAPLAAPLELGASEAREPRVHAADPDAGRAGAAGQPASDLFAELRSAHELGLLGDLRLAEFLAQLYLEHGQPRRALELLKQHGSRNVNAWVNVAQALARAGDAAGQKDALLAALQIAPRHDGLLDSLGRIDPKLAVSQLSLLLAAETPPGNPTLRARLASALLQSGRPEQARALIEGMLLENPDDNRAIRLLSELDPAHAVAYVERQIAASSESSELRGVLVDLFARVGDVAGAEAALERLVRAGQVIEPDEWGKLAELWLETDQTARGLTALQRAFGQEHGDPDQWVQLLGELAPDDLMAALERRVASDEALNDEYWGSLADAYWRAGRHAEARSAWERALVLDPKDDEWSERLEALDQGLDPYN